MKLYAFPIVIIIAILLALGVGVGGSGLLKGVNSTQTLIGVLTAYDGTVTAADTYVTACAEKQIPQTCVPTAKKVVAAVNATTAAYAQVKQYGQNPPTNVATALIDAFAVLQAAMTSTGA